MSIIILNRKSWGNYNNFRPNAGAIGVEISLATD